MSELKTKYSNRLINEKSPYLLQHAHNPVDWYPWGEEAFEKAKNEDKPIFLSIGYSTCHWCHVMERESFEDERVGELLNLKYVSIKVDREERPDIDHIYMDVCQAMTGGGGWPLTIILDTDKTPFFAATYIPNASLQQLLVQIDKLWNKDREKLLDTSRQVLSYLNGKSTKRKDVDDNISEKAYSYLRRSFDGQYGGFGTAPKFPTPHLMMFLMEYGGKDALEMTEITLKSIYAGGIYDHIGHGFCRYSTDKRWLVPHFEKMLYDNSLLSYTYLKAYTLTKNNLYKKAAVETLGYMLRVLHSPEGGFYSAEDADSEGEEGKFYVWAKGEVEQILGENAQKFCRLFDITENGNFENINIPNRIGRGDEEEMWVEECRQKLFVEREKRVHPFLDDKILTSWNALAIASFAYAGVVLNNLDYIEKAENAYDFIEKNLYDENGVLLSRYRAGEAKYTAHAEDYSFYIRALLELHNATHKLKYLSRAVELTDVFTKNFWDSENGGFFFSSVNAEKLISRPKPAYDGAIPSANSVAALNMLKLSQLTGDFKYEDYANSIFSAFAEEMNSAPTSLTYMVMAHRYSNSDVTKAVVVTDAIQNSLEFVNVINKKTGYKAEIIVISKNEPMPENLKKHYESYTMKDNQTTAYICDSKGCRPPITDIEELGKMLQ